MIRNDSGQQKGREVGTWQIKKRAGSLRRFYLVAVKNPLVAKGKNTTGFRPVDVSNP